MRPSTRNPAAWGADRASEPFCVAAERSEGTPASLNFQADLLERAITSGAIIALRKRAALIRQRAAGGVTIVGGPPMTIVKTSESAHAFKIATDLDAIADDLESGGA
jgi:hypothetical protein